MDKSINWQMAVATSVVLFNGLHFKQSGPVLCMTCDKICKKKKRWALAASGWTVDSGNKHLRIKMPSIKFLWWSGSANWVWWVCSCQGSLSVLCVKTYVCMESENCTLSKEVQEVQTLPIPAPISAVCGQCYWSCIPQHPVQDPWGTGEHPSCYWAKGRLQTGQIVQSIRWPQRDNESTMLTFMCNIESPSTYHACFWTVGESSLLSSYTATPTSETFHLIA